MYKIFISPLILLLFVTISYSKPYGLRKTDKVIQFDGTAEINYMVINHEPFSQLVVIPELTFGKANLGFGLYLPFSLSRDLKPRTVEYNSIQGLLGRIYYIQYAEEGKSPVSVKISTIDDYTLGYGLILQRYSNELFFPEIRKLGLQVSFHRSGVYFRGLIGDLSTQSVSGGRLSFKLGEMASTQAGILSRIELGITLVTDLNPKSRDIIEVNSFVDHRIVRERGSSSSVAIYGADFSLMLLKSSWLNLSLYGEFAKINLSGEGIGYGVLGSFLPKSLGIKYKFQFRHFFNSFSPSYFNTFYDAFRSSKVDSIGSQRATLGWYAELSRSFYKDKLGISVSYDQIFNGEFNPHLFLKFYTHNLPRRFYFTLRYDRFNFTNAGQLIDVENLDSRLLIELLYGLTRNIEFGFSYRKGFTIEKDLSETRLKLVAITIFTKVFF